MAIKSLSIRSLFIPLSASLFFAAPYSTASAPAAKTFLPLIELTVTRLSIAKQVALVKWDSGSAIEDLPREEEVLATARTEARAAGISDQEATHFFSDQIEANKLVQYGLYAQWRRIGGAPNEPRADLARDIRPTLDRLQKEFLQVLVSTRDLRTEQGCGERLARETQLYVKSRALEPLYGFALERALARVCVQG
ncbi:chorismate mutase [Paraburkholderia sp. RL17-347-BIC-D]|uniref:chorismate mutase n=1 Tax=Paraburkholderia sp. RL17-347-BIC-D TaxID=3031632 RepID=UPI0038BBFCDE